MPPAAPTLLDHLKTAGFPVVAIGKIEDLFAKQGVTHAIHTASDDEGMDEVERAMEEVPNGLIFANLVDFDTQYGHRNDVAGYAANLERFDARLSELLPRLCQADLFVITADHGNDPTTSSTDHSREYVPLLVAGPSVRRGVNLGTRTTFADLAQTLAAFFGLAPLEHGRSFLADVWDVQAAGRAGD
jgi:phosphopentomutase